MVAITHRVGLGRNLTAAEVDANFDNLNAAVSGAGIATTVTATSTLPDSALGKITPVNAAGATTQTLPSAATAWAADPYGLVVLAIKGAGIPVFAAGGGDTLHATSGIPAGVQYGMMAAQVISATEWALA